MTPTCVHNNDVMSQQQACGAKRIWLTAERTMFSEELLVSQTRPPRELVQHGLGALKVPLAGPVPAARTLTCQYMMLHTFIHSPCGEACVNCIVQWIA